jgi:glycosyltransferase involved in cell wall biosynthesis
MAKSKPEISAIVVCFNEEDNIRDCLESLRWCDEIIVVDSFSTDGTVEICREYTDRVIQRPWAGYRDQKAFAHSQATREWVFLVDADERVPPELRDEIDEALSRRGDRFSAFSVPRLVRYLGRWWWRGGWYPDYDVRIFRRERATWGGSDPHERILVEGKVRRLKHALHHFSYRDITDHVQRINHFTNVSSRELKGHGGRWSWMDNLLRPGARFFRSYVWKRGFLEGLPGFFVAATAAVYVFLKYAKLRELELRFDDAQSSTEAHSKSRPEFTEGKSSARVGVGDHRQALKILHIDPERAWGGGEAQVIGLLSHLSLRGLENHLLCHPGGLLIREARKRGIRTFPIEVRNDLDPRPIFPLRRLIRTERYDIVHFHTKRAHALSLWLGRVHPGVKYVVTRRMDYPVRRSWYHHYLYNRQVDGIVAISEEIARLLAEGGVRREKIRVIHSGIDPAPFERARVGRKSGPPVIGTVAVLEERKGHRFLLEAAALLKRQGHRLNYRFAGAGSERKRLENMAVELGLKEEVVFAGFVSDMPSFLSTIDVFVLPSIHEGLGVAVLEAMAAGKPVVATRVGGLPELVDDRVTGLLVPPKDSSALASAISHVISQSGLKQEMGAQAWKRVQRDFTAERMAERNEEFYYEILNPLPGRAKGEDREATKVGVREG